MKTHAQQRWTPFVILAASLIAAVAAAITATAANSATTAPKVLLRGAKLDVKASTVNLPLFRGETASGAAVWYIVTESSSKADADRRGVNWAPRLKNALGTRAVQRVRLRAATVIFPGTVDYRPKSSVVPGEEGFPPKSVAPGAIGDRRYSPLLSTGNGIVVNASHVANSTGQGDNVVELDRTGRRVTLKLLTGFTAGQTVHYLRTDASVEVVSTLEESVLAKNLDAAPGVGSNAPTSARSAIIPIVNGVRGKNDPQRQGLQSAVLGEGSPLNIQQSLPGGADYSPIWDVHPAVWSQAAIDAGQRKRLTSAAAIAAAVKAGQLESGGTGPANPSLGGLRAAGFISNCPTVAVG